MGEQYQLDHSLDNYIAKLTSYGVQVNKKLQPAFFSLKNGLKYPGLLTTAEVDGKQTLVKIPINLILTSHRALKEPELTEIFDNSFYKEGPLWQDRILVTFLLYLLSTNKECIWLDMAKQFSKDIDIISFWQKAELDDFVDKTVAKAAGKERQHFEAEWKRFSDIQQDYPILANEEWFNKENYKWIYIHAISRCFGSFLNSTYFVPYCQLFNHHYVDVSYACFNEAKEAISNEDHPAGGQDEDAQTNSVTSGYSQDYVSDDDFDYMSINSYLIKWCSKISYDLKDKETKIIEKQLKEVYDWMDRELEWKGFTFIYLGQIIQKFKILENQYKAGRKKFQHTTQKIEETKMHVYAYRKYLVQFYRTQGRQYQKIKNEKGVQYSLSNDTSWKNYDKTKEECKDQYTHFKMEARQKAHFSGNSQIYFCYGKLSNRTLLVRYGFCIEDNPYEHVWIKYPLGKYIQPYPDLFDQIQTKGLSVNYKIKLKAYTFTMQPIILMRMVRWQLTHHRLEDIFFITDLDKQMDTLEKVRLFYGGYLERYVNINQNLSEKEMGYHPYFIRVYNIEKKKILNYQVRLIDYVLQILQNLKDHSIDIKNLQLNEQYRKPLKHYIKGLRGLSKI